MADTKFEIKSYQVLLHHKPAYELGVNIITLYGQYSAAAPFKPERNIEVEIWFMSKVDLDESAQDYKDLGYIQTNDTSKPVKAVVHLRTELFSGYYQLISSEAPLYCELISVDNSVGRIYITTLAERPGDFERPIPHV